ncbi:MAG: ATP-binding protein [Chloroflexota bacterium]|nr:ATP-binding protein [Chloroflexota bacterium]
MAPTTHTPPAETQPDKQDQRLSTIFEVAKIMATQQNLETMLAEFLSCLVETLEPPEAGLMLLYDPADECLTVRAAQGYDLARLRPLRLALGEATCGKTFQTGEAQLYPTPKAIAAGARNLTPENRETFQAAIIGRRQLRSAICIPLFSGETKVGVLRLENRHQPDSFVRADIPFLEAVTDLIALTIENARLREELQATQALEEANRLKAELISTLAHEMRTPLTSIKGYSTAMLMEEATFSLETQQEFLQIIDEECDILQDLIHDLLESSIIDAGLLRLEPQPVMLPRLVKNVTDDIMHRAPEHHFLIDFPKSFPIVDADPRRIEQVLRNLLDNAIKYSLRGGLIVVRGEAHGDEVIISVADQGVGIAPEHLNRLFEKFFRVRSALGRHVVGSGLGLPIARTIIESHGGRIWAESQVGEGSTFYFTLPLEDLTQEPTG